jgi:penicillin-binding protein 1A
MAQFRTVSLWQKIRRFALGVDAGLDHGIYSLGRRLRDGWARYATALDGLHVSGARKTAVTLAGEAMTLGTAGSVVMLALAVPAFRETQDENWLKKQDLAVTFLDRYGTEIGKRGIRHDDSIRLDEMPDHFVKAVLSTEDRRFYDHFGIDLIGLARAISVNARASGVVQGGSSITQQLAKNLFLTNERSLERKIKEAFLALWLESRLTKAQILKLYLDRAYMGGGAFGAQAAAEFYFGKSLKDVTLAEAAMLAGLFKAPAKFAPHVNLPAARARANDVLSNLVEAGALTDSQVYAARRNPATPVERRRDVTADYYLDWAFGEMKRLADAGKLGDDRVVTVKTSLDLNLQRRAESAMETGLRQYGPQYEAEQGAVVLMDIDGALRAMVGGRDYGASQFNRATDALRQPGSSFKPFVYAAALASGRYSRNSTVVDRSVCLGNWCPQNYGRSFSGSMPLTSAVARSINSVPVIMSIDIGKDVHPGHDFRAARLGRERIVQLMRKMGVSSELKDTPSMPIGSVEVSVLEMAAGYASFPNAGQRSEPHAAIEVRNSRGDLIYRRDRDARRPERIMPESVAADMNFLLSKVPEEGTGRRAAIPGVRSAGKTGTTTAYRDAWYVGYTGNYVAAVWVGNDDYSATDNMTGGTLPAMIWHDVMTYAHEATEIRPIFGVPPMDQPAQKPAVAAAPRAPSVFEVANPERPVVLSRRSAEVIAGIGDLMRDTRAARAQPGGASPAAFRQLTPTGPSLAGNVIGGAGVTR